MNRAVASNPLWNNLLSYWTGDNTPNDSKGTANGTLTNGATYGTGKINNGFSFDGINDYVALPSFGQSFSAPTSAFTISAWVNVPALSIDSVIFNNGNAGMGILFTIRANGFGFYYRGGNSVVQTATAIPTNTWVHLVGSYDGAGTFKLYQNGSLLNTFTGRSWTDGTGTCTTFIGTYGAGVYGNFNGKIDELGTWTRDITATEVTELYNSGSGKQYPL
jgi:hypothetical protein